MLVWSKAPSIVGAHDTGPMNRSKSGFWLSTPTEAAGRGLRGGKMTPGEWKRRRGLRLRFVCRRRGPSLLVAEGRLNSQGGSARHIALQDRPRAHVGAHLRAGFVGQVAEAAGLGTGCGDCT